MKIQKLQRLIEKELEKKRTRGKRTHSVASLDSDADREHIFFLHQRRLYII